MVRVKNQPKKSDCTYKIKDIYPGREFSEHEQQRLAAQISGTLMHTIKNGTST